MMTEGLSLAFFLFILFNRMIREDKLGRLEPVNLITIGGMAAWLYRFGP
jgi:hypothetical protein